MIRKWLPGILMFFVVFSTAHAQDAKPDPMSGLWVSVNPGDPRDSSLLWNFQPPMKGADLYNLARARGIFMAQDAPPVTDDLSVFMEIPESRIRISGLRSNLDLVLYIDFVRYHAGKRKVPSSRLDIFIAFCGREKRIASLFQSDLRDKTFMAVALPVEFSSAGRFELVFREYGEEQGFWGIWDMWIADRNCNPWELPMVRPPQSQGMSPYNMQIIE